MKTTKEINARLKAIRSEIGSLTSEEIRLTKHARKLATQALANTRARKGEATVKVEDIKIGDFIFREGDYKMVIGREAFQGRVSLYYRVQGPNCNKRSFNRGQRITVKVSK